MKASAFQQFEFHGAWLVWNIARAEPPTKLEQHDFVREAISFSLQNIRTQAPGLTLLFLHSIVSRYSHCIIMPGFAENMVVAISKSYHDMCILH